MLQSPPLLLPLLCVLTLPSLCLLPLPLSSGIMSTPCIVFLDEPTSGLDSFAALNVMAYMRGMANKFSQTVVSSIHQPRSAIWQMFDRVRSGTSGPSGTPP